MSLITVDNQRCIKCGRCAAVCPRGLIRLEAEGPSETCEKRRRALRCLRPLRGSLPR